MNSVTHLADNNNERNIIVKKQEQLNLYLLMRLISSFICYIYCTTLHLLIRLGISNLLKKYEKAVPYIRAANE